MEQDAWDPSVLQAGARASEVDVRRFAEMGEITPEEVIDFHYAVQRLSADSQKEAEQT